MGDQWLQEALANPKSAAFPPPVQPSRLHAQPDLEEDSDLHSHLKIHHVTSQQLGQVQKGKEIHTHVQVPGVSLPLTAHWPALVT